jgi:toxin ParE1/3/4
MSEIIWSPEALQDLRDISDYIAHQSEYYANQVIEAIFLRTAGLLKQPYSGRVVPEKEHEKIREVFQYRYRIIYSLENLPNIEIARVYHMSRIYRIQ